MRDDAVLGRALPLDRGLGPQPLMNRPINQMCTDGRGDLGAGQVATGT